MKAEHTTGRRIQLVARYLRDWVVFAPCYIAIDWASSIGAVSAFNITPWNPQPALAIAWMMLAGPHHAPAVAATIVIADVVVRDAPGGLGITVLTGLVLAFGYTLIAWALRATLRDASLRTVRELTIFSVVVVAGTGAVGAAFVGILRLAGLLGPPAFADAWELFWIGDTVGILVTLPLLLAVADDARRSSLVSLARRPEALLQALLLAATIWLVFSGLGKDATRHFYLLFLPLIWIAVRTGMSGAVVAIAIVQVGVVLGIHDKMQVSATQVELQALVAALTLTGLYLGVVVEERGRAAESYRQTLRLAAAGEMAGAIAHEVNQPLTALANYGRAVQMLLAASPGGDSKQASEIVGRMLSEADRAAEVVRRLRDFFRLGSTRLESMRVEELAAYAGKIAAGLTTGRGITLQTEIEPGLPPLYVDRLQVELVLRNLVANAVEALAGQRDGRISLSARRHDAGHLDIAVVDDGPGVPVGIRERLFEPMVSGKTTGMGMGLAVSRAIAEAHGGSLEARATRHGEFHLVLPCLQAS